MKSIIHKVFSFKNPQKKRLWLRWLWPIIILTVSLETFLGGKAFNPMYYSYLLASGQGLKAIGFDLILMFRSVLISSVLVAIVNFCICSRIFRYGFLLLVVCLIGNSYLRVRTTYCYPIMFQSFFSKLGYHACDEIMDIDFFVKQEVSGQIQEKKIKLKVPRYYMPKGITEAEDTFRFYLLNPTLEPYYKAPIEEREGEFNQPVEVKVILRLAAYRGGYKPEPAPYETHIEDVYDLKAYILESDQSKITPNVLRYSTFYYYPKVETGVEMVRCGASHHYHGKHNCRMYVRLADYFDAEIFMDSRLLKDWKRVNEVARQTFLSFVQE